MVVSPTEATSPKDPSDVKSGATGVYATNRDVWPVESLGSINSSSFRLSPSSFVDWDHSEGTSMRKLNSLSTNGRMVAAGVSSANDTVEEPAAAAANVGAQRRNWRRRPVCLSPVPLSTPDDAAAAARTNERQGPEAACANATVSPHRFPAMRVGAVAANASNLRSGDMAVASI
eukprot:CAMPEP_0194266924 /NCGR_PEP_ID=MMETSP0169-20130528/1651_1 /TAXON_ID=218684 /ORGANISM="Corethron pennatum, Strain L29A3" /LENGTH=173 /DNA_ID=CAMNT_0039007701 /DNA_START=610 /DNA_END=1131 /DNA_ORIENTATION=-